MFSSDYVRRVVGGTGMPIRIFGVVAAGGVALGAVTHPAIATAAISALNTAVSCATTTACVSGTNTKGGPGVSGTSATGVGVSGKSTSGHAVQGVSNSSAGVFGQTTSGTAGVLGSTVSSYGVEGFATSTTSTGAIGVYGSSSTGYGVYGVSNSGNGFGVEGIGAAEGVVGISNTGNALEGISKSASEPALYISANGSGGSGGEAAHFFANTTAPADGMYVQNSGTGNGLTVNAVATQGDNYVAFNAITAPSGYGFGSINNSTGNYVFYVDGDGNLTYTGSLVNVVRATGGKSVASYAPRSSAPTIEDNGSAQLVGGFAVVRLDPTFAATIDPRDVYHVVITPEGDTRGLYVAAKTPTGFTVRESQGGHSTVSFDYRVVAESSGQAGVRMAAITRPIGPRPYTVPASAHAQKNPSKELLPARTP